MGHGHYLLPGRLYLFFPILPMHRVVAEQFSVVVRRPSRAQERRHRRLPAGEGLVPLQFFGVGLVAGSTPGLLVFLWHRAKDSRNYVGGRRPIDRPNILERRSAL